jgi:hypothetical protein
MEISQKNRKFAEFSFTPKYLGNPTSTATFYPLQLLNYDRDAATDPSLQNNADPSPFSLPGWKTVDQHFACSNNLYAFSEYTLLFLLPHAPSMLAKCYRMGRIRLQFARVCAVYASKLLPHAPHTLVKCYRMRCIR